jgi:addiction module HigA family antidote
MAKIQAQTPGTVLKTLLDEYQLNPNKLGKEIKLSQSAVRQVAIGKTKISVPVALRFAKYFGTTADYWLDMQKNSDLEEAAKDKELSAILKTIGKAKKPAPPKETPQAIKPGANKPARKARTKKEKAAP